MSDIVEIRQVTKRFGQKTAVDNLTLKIPERCIFGLLGSNGAGKTTTLGMCCGLIRPTKGDILISGESIIKRPDKAKSHLGLLTQNSGFYPYRTGYDHLVLYGKLSGVSDPKGRAIEMLEKVDLEKRMNDKVRTYSNGMQKLLNLAQAFLADPDVVFLDEPIAGLDPQVAYRIKEIIKKEKKRRTILLSSHYLEMMEKICTHVAIMDQGKLLKTGTLSAVKGRKSLENAYLTMLK